MSDRDNQYVPVAREHLAALLGLLGDTEHDDQVRHAAYERGREALLGSYDAGYALGHDTGYGARQDTRGFVHGILDGWEKGCEARQQLADDIRRGQRTQHLAARQADREAEAS